jgi:hypothetical protein
LIQHATNDLGNLNSEEGGDSIPNLDVLRRSVAQEHIRIRERLQSSGLAYCEASALGLIMMDKRVSILGDVARNSHAEGIPKVHAESILEDRIVRCQGIDVPVFRKQAWREVGEPRTLPDLLSKGGHEHVPDKIRRHVGSGLVIRQ